MAKTTKKPVAKGSKPAPKKPASPRVPRATKPAAPSAGVAFTEEGNPLLALLTALGSGEIAEAIAAAEVFAKRLADRDRTPPTIWPADRDIALSGAEALARRLAEPRPFSAKRVVAGRGGAVGSTIIAACSRPEGASSRELFDATGWKFASWSHQLKLAATKTGWTPEIRKVDGTTRYFLREPGV